ncbi:hypothetical protein B0A55_05023 [Friedmanniomyces simplex]|uniref:Transcription factor domain-containing protein n=1 Tax=Friedmanniomyces simplex TaxID=329884 RepID=A0A4U0XE23_9PEZI|nr:hypothetical protein B0A55_05023 [Friedmanniomyces simplex]
MGHVLRRCPNVTQLDRETVFFHVQQTPSVRASNVTFRPVPFNDTAPVPDAFVPETTSASLPYPGDHFHSPDMLALVQQQSALDTLAEVSRRHLDYSEFHRQPHLFDQQHGRLEDGHALAEQALAAQLQQVTNATASASATSLDPQLGQLGQVVHHLGGPGNGVTAGELMSWNPTNQSGQQAFGALSAPSIEPTSGFGLLSRKQKTRARGRFTDTRRKEVQGIHEFGLWSSNLLHTKAGIEVPAAVLGMHQLSLEGRIEARFFINSDLCMTFAVKQYSNSHDSKQTSDSSDVHSHNSSNIWLLDEGDTICDKIEAYTNITVQVNSQDEASAFLQATMKQAQTLMREELDREQFAANLEQGSRSCYNLQARLVTETVELWVATNMLAAPEKLALELQYVPDSIPGTQPQSVSWGSATSSDTQSIDPASATYSFVKSQLLAAIESRCSRLAKGIINELERRLLQRQQASRFGTFISAVLLLSAVERMTGLYRTFDDDGHFAPGVGFTSWPLDEQPDKLWRQGEHFADLLIMLLRIRGLPPKTTANQDGMLVAVQDRALSVHINGRPVKDSNDVQSELAVAWLDPIRLSVSDLLTKRDTEVPEREAEAGAWDMRFLSKLLLPENSR